ncbi:MAG TPA: hypothetical protein VN924_21925 [Bryobacteraceae bacterium]|jgi:hypothetical protein|nr:hypothetical protein [Bryobacteraceae bacterium]
MKSLNIKDPEAHQLAAAIAQELRVTARSTAAHVKRLYLDHADFLYDENGLPK